MAGGIAAGLLTTWVTFVPCFLWIFIGAPHVERLRHNVALSSSLAAITAAVVGVILHLGLWFALHYIFTRQTTLDFGIFSIFAPDFSSLNWAALGLTIAAIIALFRFKIGVITLIIGSGLVGLGLAIIS